MGEKEQFIADLYPAAQRVSAETGMSWELILAQAAQETGWGERVPPGTHNLFNISADSGWQGPSRSFRVPEYIDGRRQMVDAEFRAYGSFEEALRDRMELLRENPRYANAGLFREDTLGNLQAEAAALQRAGYSTDTRYAEQLVEVFNGPTMRRGLALAEENAIDSPMPSITDASHPRHDMFSEVSRRIEEATGHPANPEAAANIVLRMQESGIQRPGEIRGFALSGTDLHVQGAVPGARVTANLDAPTETLPEMSEKIARNARDLESQEQSRQLGQPPGPVLG